MLGFRIALFGRNIPVSPFLRMAMVVAEKAMLGPGSTTAVSASTMWSGRNLTRGPGMRWPSRVLLNRRVSSTIFELTVGALQHVTAEAFRQGGYLERFLYDTFP